MARSFFEDSPVGPLLDAFDIGPAWLQEDACEVCSGGWFPGCTVCGETGLVSAGHVSDEVQPPSHWWLP